MLKTIEKKIDLETSNKIVSLACKNDYDVETFEGGLNDMYFFENDKIRIKRFKPRKYVIIEPRFRNTQSNDIYLIMTDDEGLYNQKLEKVREYYEEDYEEDY